MKILFFDGYCSLCNSLVDWLIRRDHRSVLKFASLQGKTAEEKLPQQHRLKVDIDTVLYLREDKVYDRSTAVLYCLWDLGGIWKLMMVFIILPSFLRNIVYRCVAKNRYRMFGKLETCRVPKPHEKEKLLP